MITSSGNIEIRGRKTIIISRHHKNETNDYLSAILAWQIQKYSINNKE